MRAPDRLISSTMAVSSAGLIGRNVGDPRLRPTPSPVTTRRHSSWRARACPGCCGTAEAAASRSSYDDSAPCPVVDRHEQLVIHVRRVSRLEGGPRNRPHHRQLTRVHERPLDLAGQIVGVSRTDVKTGTPSMIAPMLPCRLPMTGRPAAYASATTKPNVS